MVPRGRLANARIALSAVDRGSACQDYCVQPPGVTIPPTFEIMISDFGSDGPYQDKHPIKERGQKESYN